MSPEQNIPLKRAIKLPVLTFYGLGTILGAGIYVLIGEISAKAGLHAPVSFALAALCALFSAFSYAELSSRFPQSAGEAAYAQRAFQKRKLTAMTGFLILLTSIFLSVTLAKGFGAYFRLIFGQIFFLQDAVIIVTFILGLGFLAGWGIEESSKTAAIFTCVEIAGLLMVIVVAALGPKQEGISAVDLLPNASADVWKNILGGVFLSFFAFIGFEDMANVAEEVENPRRNLPRAIFLSLLFATLLYMGVAIFAVLTLDMESLGRSQTPMALLFERNTGWNPLIISGIGLIAVTNGALVQMIRASRVLYGLSREKQIPAFFGVVHPKTQTPLNSTLVIIGVILVMAFPLSTTFAAELTCFFSLLVFTLVNISLIAVKKNKNLPEHKGFKTHIAIPWIGGLITLTLSLSYLARFF